jgi:galactoside 2-L-fucosyltransferase 1/2
LNNYTQDNVTHQYLKALLTRPPAPLIPVTWIGIHIRRTDFLIFFKIDTSLEYLNLAMNYYRGKYVNCRFLIASDDKEYAKKHFGHNSDVFITPQSFYAGEDLAALAFCEHTIATAGSYGWWAGWLAGGNVIHDLNYPVATQNCIREHYFPPWFLFPHNTSFQPSTSTISNN